MRRSLIATLAVTLILCGLALWATGSTLIAVQPRPVVLPQHLGDTVRLEAGPDRSVEGTFLAGDGRGAVLLLHGIHADRRQMVQRARFLHALGYSVLSIDLPGQGASTAPATIDETRRLFAAARAPKTLWIVAGAAHVDLHHFAPAEYERRVGGFLNHHLRQQ